jgi:all-trans-8'-apo-beta-carotenal 15,15'-oxygenase
MTAAAPLARPLHAFGFEALHDEMSYWVEPSAIRGRVPEDLRGTFFRIGPGRNKIGNEAFGHWFDGDGMMNAVTFDDRGVHYKNRYVRTPKYIDETRAQRIVHRSFGHQAPGGWRKNIGRLPANCANTSLVFHADKLLALWEGGRPWRLDPYSLDTIGEYDFDGKLKNLTPFSAHGKLDPRTQCYYNFGVRPGLNGKADILMCKISPTGHMVQRRKMPIDYFGFCHDFGVSEHYAIFLVSPIAMKNPLPWALGQVSFDRALEYRPDMGMKAYVVKLADFSLVASFPLDPCVIIHFSNCYEENDEVVVDVTRFEDFRVNAALRDVFNATAEFGGHLARYRFNLKTGTSTMSLHKGMLPCEFPVWDERLSGKKQQMIYAAAMIDNETPGFFNALQKINTGTGEVWTHDFGPGRYTSEPRLVTRPGSTREDDGYLVAMVLDTQARRSEVVVVDAETLQQEIAVIPLRHHVPFGFHGGFVRKTFLPESLVL